MFYLDASDESGILLHGHHAYNQQFCLSQSFVSSHTRRALEPKYALNWLWDCYWGLTSQLLANFFHVPSNIP